MFSETRRALFAGLLLLWLAVLACGVPAAPTPQPSPAAATPRPAGSATPDTAPLAGVPLATLPEIPSPSFAPFRLTPLALEAKPPAYPLRLDRVTNESALATLSEAQREMLAERGFVAVATPYATFGELYRDGTEEGFPLLLTTDVALYTLDVIADVAWQRAELRLVPHLQALSEGMVAATLAQWEGATSEALATAAWHNLAYLSVGSRLLDPDFVVPSAVAHIVDEEMTLIGQGGIFISPLYGDQLDYGQLQPGDRYAAAPVMARYFQARHWYSLPFVLDSEQPGRTRAQTRQLALLALALEESNNLPRWQRVYEPLAYFENGGTTRSLAEVRAALAALGGPATLDGEGLEDLAATLLALPARPEEGALLAASYTFLPPSVPVADSLLPAFVFNRVGTYTGEEPLPPTAVETNIGPIRSLPRVLDVAAALGSMEALDWLAAAGDTQYQGYDSQLARMQEALQIIEPDSYAAVWLQATRPLLAAPEAPMLYARDEAWAQHRLNAWFGGWLLLHDDTQLVARPVEQQPAESAPLPGFVEAEPELWGALVALARQVEEGLRERDLLDDEAGQKLLQLERLYSALELVAVAARRGEPLGDDTLLLLQQLAPRLEALLTFAPLSGGVPRIDAPLPRQVDIYADPSSGATMTALLGRAWPIYILVERSGKLWVASGAIFSTYEQRRDAGAEELDGPADAELAPSPWLVPLLERAPTP